jgi:quercetin dioxygenase-like cupin family protein
VQSGLAKLFAATGSYPHDSGAKAMLLFKEPGEEGLSLAYAWFKSGYILPRHSHNADCLYYVLAGELHMGSQRLLKGDGVFIPANSAYTYEAGPQGVEVLEFRNATRFHLMFHGNDEAHWDRIANVLRNNCPKWENELPPGED